MSKALLARCDLIQSEWFDSTQAHTWLLCKTESILSAIYSMMKSPFCTHTLQCFLQGHGSGSLIWARRVSVESDTFFSTHRLRDGNSGRLERAQISPCDPDSSPLCSTPAGEADEGFVVGRGAAALALPC